MRVIVAAAGTAGHINPGLAIANKIKEKEPNSEIIFIGTPRGLENDLVPRAGYGLKTIEAYAFEGCDNLTNITLPDSLTTIGDSAFSNGCSYLINLFIPASVQNMGEKVFCYVSSLSLRCEASSKPSGWNTNWKIDTVSVSWGETR